MSSNIANSTINYTPSISGDIQTDAIPTISSYGALLIPLENIVEEVQNNPKKNTDFKGKLTSAFKNAGNSIKNAITNPIQTFDKLAKYMKDERSQISGLTSVIGDKFSGIAVTQAIINGKVTSKEALDYLFMGFAPALGIQGSLMGYSGLSQMKDALSNGTIDVGSFVSGFARTLQGAIDFKDMLTNKDTKSKYQIIEFDLTLSHSETYQSETPDRRVQNGQSLNEYIHNMPVTIEVQCALQEGKRYSKSEFRTILNNLREKKKTVSLILGDEMFNDLVLTNFNPSHDCSKSGMDYSLSFKKILLSNIDTQTEVIVQTTPKLVKSSTSIPTTSGSSTNNTGSIPTGGKNGGVTASDYSALSPEMTSMLQPQTDSEGAIGSMLYSLGGVSYTHDEIRGK